MAKTKELYAEMVLKELSDDFLGRDFKILPREVYLRLDSVVNAFARDNFFKNWEVNFGGVGEQFLTTWDGDNALLVIDQDDDKPSYFDLPIQYVDLPRNGGIYSVIPNQNADKMVIIMTEREYRMYKNTPAGNLEQQLAAYPKGNRLYFNQSSVKANYGDMDVQLVVRDSSVIAADQPYPIPADKEFDVIKACVEWFRDRINQGSDNVRDDNFQLQQ